MNRILMQLQALQEVPPELLTMGAIALLLIPLIVPRKYHLGVALAFMAAWLNLNRFSGLEAVANVAKVTFVLPLLAVVLASLFHPGPRRKISPWFLLYFVIPVIGAACVATTNDASLGLIYQLNFFLIALVAFFVLRTVVDYASFRYVMWSLGFGLLVPIGLSTYALVLGGHFRLGLWRFTPFQISSNQLVPMLVQFMVICILCFHDAKNFLLRIGAVAAFGTAGAQLIATGSRQGLIVLVIVLFPWIFTMIKRPVFTVLFAVVAAVSFTWVFGFSPEEAEVGVSRLQYLGESGGRYEIALQYLEAIAERPIVGLLGSSNQSCIAAETATSHPHNAYLEAFYIGGILYGVPLLISVAVTTLSALYVFWNRREVAFDTSQTVLLCALMGAIYVHGLANNMTFTSVSSWSFINLFLSGFFLNLRKDLKEAYAAPRVYAVPAGVRMARAAR